MAQRRSLVDDRGWRAYGLLGAVLFAGGCANPGPPKPPSLNLPALVTDLSARRVGDQVVLSWTTPGKTTDGALIGPAAPSLAPAASFLMTAEICRDPNPSAPKQTQAEALRLPNCRPVHRLGVNPGPSSVEDSLPPALLAGAATLIGYRIQIDNAAGRSAGESAMALAAAGQVPPKPEALRAANVEQGIELRWQRAPSEGDVVQVTREDLSAFLATEKRKDASSKADSAPHTAKARSPASGAKAKSEDKTRAPAQPTNVEMLQVPAETQPSGDHTPAGTIDTDASIGHTYRYSAERLRSVSLGGHLLEIASAPSEPVTVDRRDTFPPRRPTGLAAVAGSQEGQPAFIDLSWEPNEEPDLAGYLVERQEIDAKGASVGAREALTSLPQPAPSMRDAHVTVGHRYAYDVVAVDTSGNRSTASASVEETATGTP